MMYVGNENVVYDLYRIYVCIILYRTQHER